MLSLEVRKSPVVSEPATFMIADRPIEPGQLDSRHILTPQELAERLKVPVSWIYENTRKRACIRQSDALPSIRMGKYLRFYWPEVEKWLERRQGGLTNE
jgi:excisionase family DNA binding protein